MKVVYENKINEREIENKYPYLARHKNTNDIVLIGKYDIIVIIKGIHNPGDGWVTKSHEHLFEPLKPGEIITLENN